MEGLLKGLMDVAINNNNNPNSESVDEQRSRSTWAQVVSGEQDDDQRDQNSYNDHTTQSRPSRVGETYGEEDSELGESRPSSWAQKVQEGQDNEETDGWETVQNKHKKQPHKKIHMEHWNSYKQPSNEQEFSEEVRDVAEMEPCEEELADYTKACEKLWELDFNRLVPGKDYEINVGEGKRVYDKEDMAEDTLFIWVNDDVLRRPTFSRFCALLDNYNPNEGSREHVTAEERQEQAAFIEEISRTAPIKYLYKYLSCNGMFSQDYQEFKAMLKDLWFTLYGRGGTSSSSSAFEHVFVGEIKNRGEQEVAGFHNWLQFYLEEAKGNADYQGYILPRRRNQDFPDSESQLLTVQFEWNGVLKSVSTMFIGVSPEFELALYTLCFFAGKEDNHIEVGPYLANVKCYHLGNKIGSTFPIAEC